MIDIKPIAAIVLLWVIRAQLSCVTFPSQISHNGVRTLIPDSVVGLRLLLVVETITIATTRRRCDDLLVFFFISISVHFLGQVTGEGSLSDFCQIRQVRIDVLMDDRIAALNFLWVSTTLRGWNLDAQHLCFVFICISGVELYFLLCLYQHYALFSSSLLIV